MPATREELDQFHQYAVDRIAKSESPLELDDLLTNWMDLRDRAEIDAIIERGIADIKAGNLGRPAREVTEELGRKYGLIE